MLVASTLVKSLLIRPGVQAKINGARLIQVILYLFYKIVVKFKLIFSMKVLMSLFKHPYLIII